MVSLRNLISIDDKIMIERRDYQDRIISSLDKGLILVLVGQRRVGKSYILKLIKEELERQESSNVIYIDKENRLFDSIKTYTDLNDYIAERVDCNKHTYIMVDEVQDIKEFERALRSWRTEDKTDVIVTGSNAHMLSSELSTLIGGRYREIYIQPLSYLEFLAFHKLENNDQSLLAYVQSGGLPGLVRIGLDADEVISYQTDIYHTVLFKDVIIRNGIRNADFLEKLVFFLADNTGKLISATAISKFMKSQGETISASIVINYLQLLCDAYIVKRVPRYDIHGKRLLETNDKYYFTDHGIRNAIAKGRREGDIEKVLENIVYLQLVRLGYTVYVGQLQAGEVDFVATKNNGDVVYVQVTYIVADESTHKREFGTLRNIKDNHPKYVISLSPMVVRENYEGITHLHLREFLTKGL